MFAFYHFYGGYNPYDIISKHWSYNKTWEIFQPLIFWIRDTIDLIYLYLKRDGDQGKGD